MNNKEIRAILGEITEQKAPASEINLWPAIQSRIQMSPSSRSKGNIMISSSYLRLKPVLLLVTFTILGTVFFLLPQGRALAQNILQFFNRGESNIMPGITASPENWVEQTPGIASATLSPVPDQTITQQLEFESICGSFDNPQCNIDTIRSMVDFPVFAIQKLPENMRFNGATGSSTEVSLHYDTTDQTGSLLIIQKPINGVAGSISADVGKDAVIEYVVIGDIQAEYVKGSYNGNLSPPEWDSSIDFQQMRWINQGILFTLYKDGRNPDLNRDALIELASNMTDGPVEGLAATIFPKSSISTSEYQFNPSESYPLTLDQLTKISGFVPLTPSRLPEQFTFIGASFVEATGVVELYYKYNHPSIPEASDALVIREQMISGNPDCDLCGFVQGDGKQVEQYPQGKLISKEAAIENVNILSNPGEYVEGIGWTSWMDSVGWQWASEPYIKRLRYKVGSLAIEIISYTYELSADDVIAIAEGMK